MLTRKCPRVLNDFTLAQPTIDRANRYRQAILAMEKRFVTNRFNFRYFTTILGMIVTNSFFAHRHFNNSGDEFKPLMDRLAIKLMNNPHISPDSPTISPIGSGTRRSPLECDECVDHEIVPLKDIPGYVDAVKDQKQKGKQQRCLWCNNPTSWACKTCSRGAHGLAPICPAVTIPRKGDNKSVPQHHQCLCNHRANPSFWPQSKFGKGAKRARSRGETLPDTMDVDDDDDDME